jgi:hypothetical protein
MVSGAVGRGGWSAARGGISGGIEEDLMPARRPAPPEEPTPLPVVLLLVTALAPVTGAIMSAPGMGLLLVTLGITDSILLLTGLQ